MRLQLKDLQRRSRCAIVQHARASGVRENYDYERDLRIGAGYARTIHRFKAAFTDALTFRYVVAKHFEIPATGTPLVADGTVRIPEAPWFYRGCPLRARFGGNPRGQRISYVLDSCHNDEIESIRRRGQELVLRKHTTCHRASLIDGACASQGHTVE